ncbi:MAG: hypothetical protein ACI358_08200 [Candidatus Limimorpha sp.]
MMRYKYLISSFLCLLSLLANAQSHNEQVTVEGKYRPQIKRSERLSKNPIKPSDDFNLPDYKVEDRDFIFNYDLEVEALSAMQFKGQYGVEEKENFLKAGIGSRLSPVFLFRHYSDLSRKMSLGVGVNHYSSWLNMKDYQKSSFMNNAFDLVSVTKFKSGQLRVSGNYKYDMYYLRSCSDSLQETPINDKPRDIHSFNIGLLWTASGTSYRDLYNNLGVDYKRSWVAGGISEDMFNAKAHVAYSDNWLDKRDKGNLQTVAADFELTYNNVNQALIILSANPYLNIDGDFYRLHLGARLDFKTYDNIGVYPDLMGSVFIFDNKLEFYSGLGGKSKINTFSDIVTENPFVNQTFLEFAEFGYEKTKLDFHGGVRGRIAYNLDARVSVSYRVKKNGIFYVPESVNNLTADAVAQTLQTFDIIFLDYNVLGLVFDMRWKVYERLNVAGEFSYNRYDVKSVDEPYAKAWYKPLFKLDVHGSYRYDEQWLFNAGVMVLGNRAALDLEGREITLKPAFDLSLGCDYQLAQNLTAFAEIHNMVHNKYQLYYNYPSAGFELLVGMKYRF